MVLWSVSTALSVCQFEEVPAVGPYVWEREQENEERVSCIMFCHILLVYLVHPSFDLCLALFSHCCWCYMSLLQEGWQKVVFVSLGLQCSWSSIICFSAAYAQSIPYSSTFFLMPKPRSLSLSLLGNFSIIVIIRVRF